MSTDVFRTGVVYAATAYTLWGAFPIYFKALEQVGAIEVLGHRMVWALGLVLVALALRRNLGWLTGIWRKPRLLGRFAVSALMLSINWGVYIWAVNDDRVIDASLGYFINPLFTVMLGFLVLHERLRATQWTAIGIAALGVVWLTWQTGQFPWIALALAASFATYGLLRKTSTLGTVEGLTLETLLLFPLAFGYLLYLGVDGRSVFLTSPAATQWLLIAAGPVTAIPLLLFAAGARRIPMSLLGLLQYIAPTMQLLLGVWLYHEPFAGPKLIGYALIWIALAVYSLESLWNGRRRMAPAPGI